MKRNYTLLILLFVSIISYSQNDSLVKIQFDKNLAISFPSKPDSMYKLGSEIYYVNQNNRNYMVFRQDSILIKVHSKKDFQTAMKGVIDGFGSSLNKYKLYNDIADSTIGGSVGKMIYSFKPDTGNKDIQLLTFVTILENKGYFIQVSSVGYDPNFKQETKPFIQSAKFFGKPYDELENSTAFKVGYAIGSLFVYGLLIAGVVWLISRLTRRRKKVF